MVPFAKTGGLAVVAGALPGALKRLEVDARLALPLYRMIRGKDLDMRLVLENLNVPISNDSEAWKTIVALCAFVVGICVRNDTLVVVSFVALCLTGLQAARVRRPFND